MKRSTIVLAALAAGLGISTAVQAAVVFSDSFSYPDGNLVGQGAWVQTGSSTTNPIQVKSGVAVMQTTGQDANASLTSPVATNAGTGIYTGVDLNISSAQTGDYLLHLSDAVGSNSFYQRLQVKSSGAGFVLGLLDTAGTGSATDWGSTVLNFQQTYRVVVSWNFVAGSNNDTFNVYVDPASGTEDPSTAYLTHNWTSTQFGEPAQIGTVNLRQGSATGAAAGTVDNLVVATSFAEAVPEPTGLGLLVAGAAGLMSRRRRA